MSVDRTQKRIEEYIEKYMWPRENMRQVKTGYSEARSRAR
jgi:hypothetical protein